MVLFLSSFTLSPFFFSLSVISPWYTVSPISLKVKDSCVSSLQLQDKCMDLITMTTVENIFICLLDMQKLHSNPGHYPWIIRFILGQFSTGTNVKTQLEVPLWFFRKKSADLLRQTSMIIHQLESINLKFRPRPKIQTKHLPSSAYLYHPLGKEELYLT